MAIVLSIKCFIPEMTGFDITRLDVFDPIVKPLDRFHLSDFYFSRLQYLRHIGKDTNIVLVNIGEPDREVMARELDIINKYGPKVVALDVIFRNDKDSATDVRLAEAIANTPNIILAGEIHDEKVNGSEKRVHTPSIGRFADISINSHVGLKKRNDNKACCFEPIVYVEGKPVFSMALKIAELYDSASAAALRQRGRDLEMINFRRNLDRYTTFDVEDVLGGKNLDTIKGKIVIMGFLGTDLKTNSAGDRVHTPLNRFYIANSYPDMYGAVVIANITSMILDRDFIDTNDGLSFFTAVVVYSAAVVFALLFFFAIALSGNRRAELYRFGCLLLIIIFFVIVRLFLMFFFNYMLHLPDLNYYFILAFAIFEAYAFLFKKRLAAQ